jgi:hypothetical protein
MFDSLQGTVFVFYWGLRTNVFFSFYLNAPKGSATVLAEELLVWGRAVSLLWVFRSTFLEKQLIWRRV